MASATRLAATAVTGALVLAAGAHAAGAAEPSYVPGAYFGEQRGDGVRAIGIEATSSGVAYVGWAVSTRCSDGDRYGLLADDSDAFRFDRRSLKADGTLRIAGVYAENDVRYAFRIKGRLHDRDAEGRLRVRATRRGDDVTCATGWLPWKASLQEPR